MREATVSELKSRAKEMGIKGSDGMKKAELIDAISKAQGVDQVKAPAPKIESSPEKSDYASHPKFAKFNSSQGAE